MPKHKREVPPASGDNAAAGKFAERLITLLSERDRVGEDIRDLMVEAKSAGHMPGVIRKAASEVHRERTENAEQHTKRVMTAVLVEAVKRELGAYADSPLGNAAIERAAAE